ncbi:unnamed protein product [Nezara viridula]|uniref:Uncharacterized protein n=1 Tax=Nezara viridula TaxID=85310 RepID=A0A9P0EAS6_NEZVI|nr:unnamed protein product [Nezara viridula]
MRLRDRSHNGIVDIFLSYLRNVTFILTVLIAILCITIVILWGAYRYPPGMRNFSGYVLFTHGAPALTVVFWGLVIDYLLNEEPPPKLQFIYTTSGIALFAVVGVHQFFNLDDYTGLKAHITFGLHVAVLVLLIVHFVLLIRRYSKHMDLEERPYVIRVSRGGVPVYR